MEPFDIGQGDDLCQADRHVADDEESKLLTHELCNTLHPIEALEDDVEGKTGSLGSTAESGSTMTGRRLVKKTGECNVISRHVTGRKLGFLVDLFTTIVEMRWRYHIVLFLASYVACWFVFACVYLAVVQVHGDMVNQNNTNWVPCIHKVSDFTSALMYSFETQTTIGYGSRVVDSECWIGLVVAILQILIGTLINILVTGLVFVKISRPKGRRQTLVFSKNAVVCRRDGQYQLMFRVGDMRTRSHLIGTSVRALLVRTTQTVEGESIPLCQFPLALETETGHKDSYIFLAWPVTVVHRIDSMSPLWGKSADHMRKEDFEIIVILEGTVELTGTTTQVRTSYLPSEILWGHCLESLMTNDEHGHYCIDFKQFQKTTPVNMPTCSAMDWHERCHGDDDGTTTNTELDSPVSPSFKSSIARSVSFPSQPTPRAGFPLVDMIKRLRKVGPEQPAKSARSPARSKSCTEMLRNSSSSTKLRQSLKPNVLSAVALYQPGSPVRSQGSEITDDTDSGISNLLKEDSPVHFQLEDIEEDGFVSGFGSPKDSSAV